MADLGDRAVREFFGGGIGLRRVVDPSVALFYVGRRTRSWINLSDRVVDG